MLQVSIDILNPTPMARSESVAIDRSVNSGNGKVPFFRGELFLNNEEATKLNDFLASIECNFGKPMFIEVKPPPIMPNMFIPAASSVTFSPLPPRSTRTSFPVQPVVSKSSGGKSSGGKSSRPSSSNTKAESIPAVKTSEVTSPVSDTVMKTPRVEYKTDEIPIIPANRAKIHQFLRETFAELASDQDFACLFDEFIPGGLSVPHTMSTVKQKIESERYLDHFQFQDDLISMSSFWLHGPPTPNPLLPQYMAALKLIRKSTDVMIMRCSGVENQDYYGGPDVEAAIKTQAKREQQAAKTTSSPSFARKVRRTQSTTSATGELRDIESQVARLTEQVMGLQKSKPAPRQSSAALPKQEAMSVEEIRRLEADLIKLSPEDIDFVVNNLLKDEPSVKVDDESYELDVGALPTVRQRALRKFVSRRLNIVDPGHEVQKLRQMLKQDELARASEEMAERLLASSMIPSAPPVAVAAPQPVISPEEEQRQKQREEEAKRLWRLAHGGDEDNMDID
jgi:hypothetical protein